MNIRTETPADYEAIYTFVKLAFSTAKVSDGTEQDFVNQLRAGPGYIPELALVAEEDGEIIGHIMLTRRKLESAGREVQALLLAPLAVKSEFRGRGLGAKLTRIAIEKAREIGFEAVFLVGDPDYYSRFGFVRADKYGIATTADIPAQFVQALELVRGALKNRSGTICLE